MVEGGSGQKFRYARLPFGYSYSQAICQHLVLAVVRRVLTRRGIQGWVYLDDILLSARRKGRLRRVVRECAVLRCCIGPPTVVVPMRINKMGDRIAQQHERTHAQPSRPICFWDPPLPLVRLEACPRVSCSSHAPPTPHHRCSESRPKAPL